MRKINRNWQTKWWNDFEEQSAEKEEANGCIKKNLQIQAKKDMGKVLALSP